VPEPQRLLKVKEFRDTFLVMIMTVVMMVVMRRMVVI
jgi:hypothetical protein